MGWIAGGLILVVGVVVAMRRWIAREERFLAELHARNTHLHEQHGDD